jgi:NADP-reducing hydrogenase subunit HndB
MPMKTIRSLEDLNHFREEVVEKRQRQAGLKHIQVIVSLGTCGIAAGALDTLNTVRQVVEDEKIKNVTILESGCIGLCRHEPILEVIVGDEPRVTYGRVTPETARKIMRSHVIEGRVVDEFAIESLPFPTI